jgi:hypothetical protein
LVVVVAVALLPLPPQLQSRVISERKTTVQKLFGAMVSLAKNMDAFTLNGKLIELRQGHNRGLKKRCEQDDRYLDA